MACYLEDVMGMLQEIMTFHPHRGGRQKNGLSRYLTDRLSICVGCVKCCLKPVGYTEDVIKVL